MDPKCERSKQLRLLEDLNMATLVEIVERENLVEFRELVEEKQLDGRKLLNLTEGIVKIWRPKANAKTIINFIEYLKQNPHCYIQPYVNTNKSNICIRSTSFNGSASTTKEVYALESKTISFEDNTKSTSSKQTRVRKISKIQDLEFNMNTAETIERIFRYSEPPKSFLYRNKIKEMRRNKELNQGKEILNNSYVPMDVGNPPNKERNTIASKIHDYIHFDLSKLKIVPSRKQERFDDRGYYALKRASMATEISDSYDVVGMVDFGKPKKNHSTESERLGELDEHFYEDLKINTELTEAKLRRESVMKDFNPLSKSPCMLKINEIFATFRFPHNKVTQFTPSSNIMSHNDKKEKISDIKNTVVENQSCPSSSLKQDKDRKDTEKLNKKSDTNKHFYEYNENSSGLYDSIEAGLNEVKSDIAGRFQVSNVPVEEYMEPIHPNKDYTDIMYKDKEDSIVNIILKMFENGFGYHKECEKPHDSTTTLDSSKPSISKPELLATERPMETLKKWNENLKANHKPDTKTNMADRPLPVPVQNEFYYMEVDRLEASKLLEGHADGTFILRPSSQPFHAYTISLVHKGLVHNVGVRRRPDGRLALGFSKRSEQTFATITELVEHHYRDKLMLIVDGHKIGSTQLRRLHD